MHREVQDRLEEVLTQSSAGPSFQQTDAARQHVTACPECREEVEFMAQQAALLRDLKAPAEFDAEVRPGFYARVMERIEAQSPISIWNLFIESAFGRRIAVASLALALVLGFYLVSLESSADEPMLAGDPAQLELTPDAGFDGPVATSVRQMDGAPMNGAVPLGFQDDALEVQMDQFVNQMNQIMMQMPQSDSQDGVLSDLVTYREQ